MHEKNPHEYQPAALAHRTQCMWSRYLVSFGIAPSLQPQMRQPIGVNIMNGTLLLIILFVLLFGGGGGYYGYGLYGGPGLGGALLLVFVFIGALWYMGFPRRGSGT
jgi:hypothetical protein